MPFGMGPFGWFMVPYFYPYLRYWWGTFPYWNFYQPYGIDELTYLKQMRQDLEEQLKYINERIAELEKK